MDVLVACCEACCGRVVSLMSARRWLDLSENKLSGAIPESIGALLKLRYVHECVGAHVLTVCM